MGYQGRTPPSLVPHSFQKGEAVPTDELVEEDRFETNQTTVAAFFVYSGLRLVGLQWEYGVCTFFFANTKPLQNLFSQYIQGEARVEPQGFNNATVQVKKRMFKARDEADQEDK